MTSIKRSSLTRRVNIRNKRDGFSLMEVILALALLTGAIVIFGEMDRMGSINAMQARDLTQAQLLAESKMAEITSGITTADPISEGTFDFDYEQIWLYSVELITIDQPGMVAVQVWVWQKPENPYAVDFALTRWIQDPGIELPSETGESADSSSSSSSTGGTTSGS